MRRLELGLRNLLCAAVAVLLNACAGGPPPPDWKMNAKAALERTVVAYFSGNARVENHEFQRAIGEISATGRIDLLARAELMRCAARVASLVFEECTGFVKLRADAALPERAYAEFLAGSIRPQDIALLPPQHRAVAGADPSAIVDNTVLESISDPLARLVAAAVSFQAGRANASVISVGVDTASAQAWRRPLLAWLLVQLQRAEQAGDVGEAERLRRRIGLVQGSPKVGN